MKVWETRSATFCEDILVRDVGALADPSPPLFEQLLDRANVGAGENVTVGADSGSAAGVNVLDWPGGLSEIKWEVSEKDCDDGLTNGLSRNITQFDILNDIARKNGDIAPADKDSGATKDIAPGETSFYSQVRDIAL